MHDIVYRLYILYDKTKLQKWQKRQLKIDVVCQRFQNKNREQEAPDSKNKNLWKLTTPGERTNIKGVLVVESSNTDLISNTGGSTNLKSKWALDEWEK